MFVFVWALYEQQKLRKYGEPGTETYSDLVQVHLNKISVELES